MTIEHVRWHLGPVLAYMAAAAFAWPLFSDAQGDPANPMGVLKLPWDHFEVSVITKDDKSHRHEARNGQAILPAGTYPRYRLTLKADDEDGLEWEMRSAFWNEILEIRAGQTTNLEIDTPFAVRPRPSRYHVLHGQQMRFDLAVSDGKGREWRPPRPRRDQPNLRPGISIATEGGQSLGTYKFEYG